jgi:hypothetical protein
MYGLRDQSKPIPLTRLRALLHGSSRYSTRTPQVYEHVFAHVGRTGRYTQPKTLDDDPFSPRPGQAGRT